MHHMDYVLESTLRADTLPCHRQNNWRESVLFCILLHLFPRCYLKFYQLCSARGTPPQCRTSTHCRWSEAYCVLLLCANLIKDLVIYITEVLKKSLRFQSWFKVGNDKSGLILYRMCNYYYYLQHSQINSHCFNKKSLIITTMVWFHAVHRSVIFHTTCRTQ